jgi:hypothetical protein
MYRNKEDQQKAWRAHYARNKEKYAERNRKRRAEMITWLDSLKEGKPCVQCENVFPPKAMDFHHRDPSQKEFSISNVRFLGYGKERVLQEIEKCDLLCAVCHRTA